MCYRCMTIIHLIQKNITSTIRYGELKWRDSLLYIYYIFRQFMFRFVPSSYWGLTYEGRPIQPVLKIHSRPFNRRGPNECSLRTIPYSKQTAGTTSGNMCTIYGKKHRSTVNFSGSSQWLTHITVVINELQRISFAVRQQTKKKRKQIIKKTEQKHRSD